jgi:hypothetical protein
MLTEVRIRTGKKNDKDNNGKGSNNKNINYTKFTGPQMTMEAKMIFYTDDWHNKLTDAQRKKLKDLEAKVKAENNNSPVSQTYNNNSSETQPEQ